MPPTDDTDTQVNKDEANSAPEQENKEPVAKEHEQENKVPVAKEPVAKDDEEEERKEAEKRKAVDGDEVDVDDKGSVSMPFSAFQKRLTRAATQATKSALKDIFGTDDASQIKKLVKQGKEAQAQLDKARREQMSEAEKLKEDVDKWRARAETAEKQLTSYEEDKLAEKGEQVVAGLASKYVSGDFVEDAVAVYQRHLSKKSDDEIDALDSKAIEDWFKDYAARKPAVARKPGERRKVAEAANNGPDPSKKPEPGKAGAASSKTPKPNQPNSMTRQEWEEYKRQRGLNF